MFVVGPEVRAIGCGTHCQVTDNASSPPVPTPVPSATRRADTWRSRTRTCCSADSSRSICAPLRNAETAPANTRRSPKIFGPNEDEPLDVEGTRKAFADLTTLVNEQQGSHLTPEEVALGFLKVATEAMCRPVRSSVLVCSQACA